MKNKKMKTKLFISIALSAFTLASFVYAQSPSSTQIKIAQNNHEEHCPKGLPSPLFDAKKLKSHQVTWLVEKGLLMHADVTATSDASALPSLVETAITPQGIPFKVTQSGCEFVNEQLDIDLPIASLEKNGKFCNECLVRSLKSIAPYYVSDYGSLLTSAVDTLAHYLNTQKIRVKHDYIDPEGGEMAHAIRIESMQKIPAENIWRIRLMASVGPL